MVDYTELIKYIIVYVDGPLDMMLTTKQGAIELKGEEKAIPVSKSAMESPYITWIQNYTTE